MAGILDAPVIQRETLGAKLRRLARQARASNPYLDPAMVAPPTWAASTAVAVGQVRTNGGNAYICIVAGTTAASGGPTGVTAANITDGTANWTYYGRASAGPTDPRIPTYTSGTTAPAYTNFFHPGTAPQFFKPYGASGIAAGNSQQLFRFNQLNGGTAANGDARVAFWTDAPTFSLFVPATSILRVRIDGRFYSHNALDSYGASSYHTFDFSAAGGRAPRLIEVEHNRATSFFAGVVVGSGDQVWAPQPADTVRSVWISDSIWAGSAYGPSALSVPQAAAAKLGWSDSWNFSIGGTGYCQAGSFAVYGARIAQALALNPDVWLFMGSFNDSTFTSAQITAAALACFQSIRSGGSRAPIIVLGVWPSDHTGITDAQIVACEQAVQASVTQFGDSKTWFIPVRQDTVPWITTTANHTAWTASTNQGTYVSGDNTHPADIGTQYLADRIVTAIHGQVLPNLA